MNKAKKEGITFVIPSFNRVGSFFREQNPLPSGVP